MSDLAWAAGFIEADGSIGFQARFAGPWLQVGQIDKRKATLERLDSIFGPGKWSPINFSQEDAARRQPFTIWRIQNERCESALRSIRPYMTPGVKDAQVDLCLAWFDAAKSVGPMGKRSFRQYTTTVKNQVSQLNSAGELPAYVLQPTFRQRHRQMEMPI